MVELSRGVDPTRPRVSVVIPCHDGVRDTRACLEALREQVLGQASCGVEPFEIVIVDNGSSDGTRFLQRDFPDVRVIRCEENLGFAGGVNRGIEESTGEFVLVLNNDTMPAPHLIARLERALVSDDRIAAVAPTSNQVKGPARIDVGDLGSTKCGREGIENVLTESSEHAPLQDVETLSGLCMLLRRSTFEELGVFDTRFGEGMFEDDDLCLRLRLAGRRLVLVRNAFVHHRGHRTFQRLGRDLRQTLEEREQTFREKWAEHPAGRAYLARMDGGSADDLAHAAELAQTEHPDWPDADLILARQAYSRHDAAALLEHVQRFLDACPKHGQAAVLHALGLLRVGRTEEGIVAFQAAIGSNYFAPEDLAEALALFGRHFIEAGDAAAAEPHLETALELAPERGDIGHLLGTAWIQLGRFAEAMPLFEVAASEDDPMACNNVGICAWNLGDTLRAEREFERAVATRPSDRSFRENLEKVRAARSC